MPVNAPELRLLRDGERRRRGPHVRIGWLATLACIAMVETLGFAATSSFTGTTNTGAQVARVATTTTSHTAAR